MRAFHAIGAAFMIAWVMPVSSHADGTTAPASTAMPITINAPTTILAAIGPSGAGPVGCEWACECVTRNRVEAVSDRTFQPR